MQKREQIPETDFERFLKIYQDGNMSVLVGAGLSMNVSDRFLSWKTLMKDIVQYIYKDQINLHCENYLHIHGDKTNNIEEIKDKYIDAILDAEDFLQLASKYIKKKGYREAIDYYIESKTPYLVLLSDGSVEIHIAKEPPIPVAGSALSIHKALLSCQKFQNVYTTNYDNILEIASKLLSKETSSISYKTVTSGKELSGNLSHNIIKIHGSIDNEPQEFQFDGDRHLRYIIAQEDYDTYIQKHEAFSYLMRIAMLQGYFCLVGFSGTDPNYLAWVRWMSDILNAGSDDKIYLLDIDGKDIPEDLLSFYSNHHIVVINLWDEVILEHILGTNFVDKDNCDVVFDNETNNNYDVNNTIKSLLRNKKELNTLNIKNEQKQQPKKEELEQSIKKYKKVILESLFKYLHHLEEKKNSKELINQDKIENDEGILAKQGQSEKNNPHIQPEQDNKNNINNENDVCEEVISVTQSDTLSEAKVLYYNYRSLWEETCELCKANGNLKNITNKLLTLKSNCRFLKVIFPQERLINLLIRNKTLNEKEACLFALAVSDIGQVPSYYNNYHKDDEELNKQPLWIQLKEREETLNGTNEPLNDLTLDCGIYEQIQRYLFHLDFSQAKKLVDKWNAKGYWIQAKAMRMAVYPELRNDAQSLLNNAIKEEKNQSEKLFDVILANYISMQWPRPYTTDEFWKYGLDGQGDLLNSMMVTLREKDEKPKRRGWIGSTTYLDSNHGNYVKSLRILQFIIDSGIYLSLPGTYLFEITSWYKVFSNLYEYFPYPCFFYSIQYNDKDVQRRIGEDFTYNEKLGEFVQDILIKSLSAIDNPATPQSFKNGILNITGVMYVAVDEDKWFGLFRQTVFKELLDNLKKIEDSDALVFNAKLALGSLKKQENIYWAFQRLMNNYATNESVVSEFIMYNLRLNRISPENALKDTSMFPNLLSEDALGVLDVLNDRNLLSDKCKEEICETIANTSEENIPHDRIALLRLVNLTKQNQTVLEKIKKCLLSMDIWFCGILDNEGTRWTEPQYIMLHLLNDKITWTDAEFDIIKENLIKNTALYDKIHEKLHQSPFMKSSQTRYLSSMLRFIDKLDESRHHQLSDARTIIERLLKDRSQYSDNIDLMMSEQPVDVDYAFNNIYEGITNHGIEQYKNDIDFMIARAIMKNPVALTCNLEYINILMDEYGKDMINLDYTEIIKKLLSIFKDSEVWQLLDLRFAFNYLYRIAKKLKEFDHSNEIIDFWLNNAFVKKFVIE